MSAVTTIGLGSRLGLISPSGPIDADDFNKGVAWLQEHFSVRYRDDILSRDGHLAGSDSRRASELREMLGDPEVDAILCTRGGYGATRILPEFSPDEVASANKPIVGFSDVTALHGLWARAGVMSWHAPMVTWLGRADAVTRQMFLQELTQSPMQIELEQVAGPTCDATGKLFGGNLRVLASMCGTGYGYPKEGAVWLVEDVGERPYRIDRMLTTLVQSGVFEGAQAVLLGDFVGCDEKSYTDTQTTHSVLTACFESLGIPTFTGVPSGHGTRNRCVPLGRHVRVSDSRLAWSS